MITENNCIIYQSDQFKMEESNQNETFYCHSLFKCCTEKYLAWWPIFFSAYFIPVYPSFIILKNCDFCNGICNFSNIFSIKNYYF